MAGSLVCVGVGMKLGAHISPLSKSHIEQADVVFTLVSNGLVEMWVNEMNPDVRSLQPYYCEGKSRSISYREMVAAMVTEVEAGKKVVGAFYGHPGVFACVPHRAIEACLAQGVNAHMEPGISAEDCLFADLAIDPGKYGCQQYEASQFMFFQRKIDPSAYLILWQIGIAGDNSLGRFSTGAAHRQVLVDLLAQDYPLDHQVILYQAAVLPIDTVRKQIITLAELVDAEMSLHTTLVIPPSQKMQKNHQILERLVAVEQAMAKAKVKLNLVQS